MIRCSKLQIEGRSVPAGLPCGVRRDGTGRDGTGRTYLPHEEFLLVCGGNCMGEPEGAGGCFLKVVYNFFFIVSTPLRELMICKLRRDGCQ